VKLNTAQIMLLSDHAPITLDFPLTQPPPGEALEVTSR